MNLFLHELKSYRRSAIIWTLALCALTVIFLVFIYPSFASDVVESRKIIANLPAPIRKAFGISVHSFFSIYGFYAYLLSFVLLAGAIQAMNLGVGVISKEESSKTADFLLTKPISRQAVMTSKLAAAFCILTITNIVYMLVTYVAARTASKDVFSALTLLRLVSILYLVQLAFLAIGLLLSVLLRKVKSVSAVSIPAVFAFYITGTLGAILGNENVSYITPFKFYDTAYMVERNRYDSKYLILEACIVFGACLASYILFKKKDIRAAS